MVRVLLAVSPLATALATARNVRGLILDLRHVSSGSNTSVALAIMGRFVATRTRNQRHRMPNFEALPN